MKRFLLAFFFLLTQQILFAQLPPWNAKFIVYHPDGYTDTVWVGCDETATDGFDIGLDSLDNSFDYPISIGAFSPEVDAEFGSDNCVNLKREILPFEDVRQYTFYIVYDDAPGLPPQIKWDSTDYLYEYEEFKISQVTFTALTGYIESIDNTSITVFHRNADNPDDIYQLYTDLIDFYAETSAFECSPQNNVIKITLAVIFKDFSVNINENRFSNYISIDPNPIQNEIHFKTQIPSEFNIKITNISGKVIQEILVYNSSVLNLDVSNLSNGIYFLQITDSENQTIKFYKLIKI